MPRLQLNAEDLAKLKVSPFWGRFNEALLSLGSLRRRRPNLLVDGWRRAASGHLDRSLAPLVALAPGYGMIELHTVVGDAPSLPEALERLQAAPAEHVGSELACLETTVEAAGSWAQRWWDDLSKGDRGARRHMVDLVRRYHTSAVEPHWRAIDALLEAERVRCGRVMAAEGVGRLLDTLHPKIRWRPPLLDVAVDETEANPMCDGTPAVDVLDGRSLVLVPSVFCTDRPWVLADTTDDSVPKLLVYPALRGMQDAAWLWTEGMAPGREALARLLGPTRADALDAVADMCTTTELARRLGIAPATASHHVGILRDAKLVASNRTGNAVSHRLTDLGAALLDGRWRRSS